MTAAEKLKLALDLFEDGEDMMRQRLKRQFPEASATEIEARLNRWLSLRPGAETGDAPGLSVDWPRRSRTG